MVYFLRSHRDHLNWAFGWCAITALGDFDPTRSARLILWELKLVSPNLHLVMNAPPLRNTLLAPSFVGLTMEE
ncbi:hypothetical protein PM082_016814 [Marasmius tenuissimus]|nr:hypothetical protein PM082_016814 [Marasmius tenuissimus]